MPARSETARARGVPRETGLRDQLGAEPPRAGAAEPARAGAAEPARAGAAEPARAGAAEPARAGAAEPARAGAAEPARAGAAVERAHPRTGRGLSGDGAAGFVRPRQRG